VVQQIPAEDLVFIDESGITTSMTRLWARAPRGKRAVGRAPAGRYERLTLLGALCLHGLSALMTIPAFTNREVFRAFVEEVLVPTLRPGQVVIWDNLPAHKYPEVEQAIRNAGCRLLFLPRYSPEFNPIEPCWSKLKNELRSRAARTLDALQEAVTAAMQSISAQDARGWFTHCGYNLAPD
jgi:transposase